MQNNIRLPAHVRPERYKIMIKPDLEGFVFFGEETIFLTTGKAFNEITLHAKELEIYDVILKNSKFPDFAKASTGRQFPISKQILNPKTETVTFKFKKSLPKGKAELSLKFKGILNDKMRGFYRSRYIHQNKEKHLAVSQFEATDARRAFPCFDEPHQKAIFDITLMIPPGTTAISNTIETSVKEHESGYKIVQFAPTPKMSTYLVAFIVGDFEYLEGKTKRGVTTRIFTTPGKKHQAKFALSCAIKFLEFYEKYFDIRYPLPVLDLIAIPDFTHGAMENWGAITYREAALLVDEEHSSASNRQWVAMVIAHELAHQWFGNLVTMEWWTHLWLNEGFASYIEYLAIDYVFPDWDIWTQFMHMDLNRALILDSLQSTHPIEIPVHHPSEIDEIFDDVSYRKGSSIIRMLAMYLGERDFKLGLRHYLKKHAYKNTSTNDLWESFEAVSKKPVSELMKNWTNKGGYPLIRIIEQKNNLKLIQTRFYSSRITRSKNADKTLWQIPIKCLDGNKIKTLFFNAKQATLPRKNGWIKLNAGETAFFRTDYPSQLLSELKNPIKEKILKPIDRAGIIRDAFALAESGQLPAVQALELAAAYANETDYTVWLQITAGLDQLGSLVALEDFYPDYERFCREIYKRIAEKLGRQGGKNEKHTAKILRSLVLYKAGFYGDKETIAWAKKAFKKKFIPSDIRSVTYSLSAKYGNRKEFSKLIKMYSAAALQEEKNRIGRALGSFQDKSLLSKALKFSLSSHVRPQDATSIIAAVWSNPYGRNLAWQFVKKNWALLVKRYGETSHLLQRLIECANLFSSQKQAIDFALFFKNKKKSIFKKTISQVLEKIYSNSAWLEEEKSALGKWLDSRY